MTVPAGKQGKSSTILATPGDKTASARRRRKSKYQMFLVVTLCLITLIALIVQTKAFNQLFAYVHREGWTSRLPTICRLFR